MTQFYTRREMFPLLGALALAASGCGGGGGGDDAADSFNAKPMVDNLTDNIITQTYRNLNTAAATLLTAVQALATGTATEDEMNTAQAAWRATRVPWESSEAFLFGPVEALTIDPAIDSWPLTTADLLNYLNANPNPTQADVDNAGDDVRGFHAIEYLLFGDGVSDNDKLASELTAAEARYLVALATALKAKTQTLLDAWSVGYSNGTAYGARMKAPGAGNASYTSYASVLQDLVTGVKDIANEVGNTKLAEPLGATLAEADTSKVESQYSWNSLTDFHNNLQSIMNMYTGKLGFRVGTDTASASLNGLYAFVAYHDTVLAARVVTEIDDAQKKIALIKGDGNSGTTEVTGTARPFREQIKTSAGRALIATAIAACNTLRQTLENNVAPLIAGTTFAS